MRRQTNHQPQSEPRTFWDKVWKDEHGRRVLYQQPNVWIIAWAVCDMVAILSSSKKAATVFGYLATITLIIWALLEIFRGVNYFRRGLGVVVLLLMITSQLRAVL